MSSFIRRIQRSQPHKGIVKILDRLGNVTGIKLGELPGRPAFNGRGKNLGRTNPKAADLIARKKREAKRQQQKGN